MPAIPLAKGRTLEASSVRSGKRRTLLAVSQTGHRGAPAGTVGHNDPAARRLKAGNRRRRLAGDRLKSPRRALLKRPNTGLPGLA
jgi:hypothetical protein